MKKRKLERKPEKKNLPSHLAFQYSMKYSTTLYSMQHKKKKTAKQFLSVTMYQRMYRPLKAHSKLKAMLVRIQEEHGQDRSCRGPALTQQLGNDVHGLAPQEQLPIPPVVTGEPPLAARAPLLQLHKVSRHVVILGDNRAPWGQQAQPESKYHCPHLTGVP